MIHKYYITNVSMIDTPTALILSTSQIKLIKTDHGNTNVIINIIVISLVTVVSYHHVPLS